MVRSTISLHNLRIFTHQPMRVSHISKFVYEYHMQIKVDYNLVVGTTYKSTYMA
jgi:hypothetical protein